MNILFTCIYLYIYTSYAGTYLDVYTLYAGKADLTRYREAGAEVISVLTQFTGCRVERASIDEAYIDLTDKVQDMMSQVSMSQLAIPTTQDLPHTFVVGSDNGMS